MLHRGTLLLGFGLPVAALITGGFVARPMLDKAAAPTVMHSAQAVQSLDTALQPETVPPPSPNTSTQPAPEAPALAPEDPKAVQARLEFDRALVDAAVLRNNYEDYKRGRSKTPVSLSSFRSLELRLKTIADADPSNTQARDMANAVRMAQFEILQPSVEIAASANRQIYAHEMSERMRDDGMRVEVSGVRNSSVRFISPHMTRQMAMQLSETANIPEKAKMLQFRRVVFGNGRRSWTYDVARGRLR